MLFTKEDSKRLLNELPRFYKEMSDQDYLKKYGVLPTTTTVRPIEVAPVVLAYVKRRKGSVIEFTPVGNPLLVSVITTERDTKYLINLYYKLVKERKKGEALESLYRSANESIYKKSNVSIDSLLNAIVDLRKDFDSLFAAFLPVDITHESPEFMNKMLEIVKTDTKNKLTVRYKDYTNNRTLGVLMPTKKESQGIQKLFIMMYNEDHSYLLNGLYGIDVMDYIKIIKTEDVTKLKDSLQRLDGVDLDGLQRSVKYSHRIVKEVSDEYQEMAKISREKIIKIY